MEAERSPGTTLLSAKSQAVSLVQLPHTRSATKSKKGTRTARTSSVNTRTDHKTTTVRRAVTVATVVTTTVVMTTAGVKDEMNAVKRDANMGEEMNSVVQAVQVDLAAPVVQVVQVAQAATVKVVQEATVKAAKADMVKAVKEDTARAVRVADGKS